MNNTINVLETNYNTEVKRKAYWVTYIEWIAQDGKLIRKMIKFVMPKDWKLDGQHIENTSENAKKVWDKTFAWKYGRRVPGTDVMINIADLNRAIHTKVNFVSLVKEGMPEYDMKPEEIIKKPNKGKPPRKHLKRKQQMESSKPKNDYNKNQR
jgi:hypothetical protein